MSEAVRPVLFCVLDGWGLTEPSAHNAVELAKRPMTRSLSERYPTSQLLTCGPDVGLPDGQMGNSEVGHMNLGAGRIVFQDLLKINRAVASNEFIRSPVIAELFTVAKRGALHLLGLVSEGGVHSSQAHLYALLKAAHDAGIAKIFVHVFTDGRDTPPRSGKEYLAELDAYIAEHAPNATIATVTGRFYAMDRDKRWGRLQRAYDALIHGRGHQARSAAEAIAGAYQRGETDEFVEPIVCVGSDGAPVGSIADNDAVFFFNFRSDRARQLTAALALPSWPDGMRQERKVTLGYYATMTKYHNDYRFPVVFAKEQLKGSLGHVVAEAGLKQFRCAETEKYPHVTFFFNGGRDEPFPGESRQMVDSPKDVKTYDQKPQMSAPELTDVIVDAVDSQTYQLFICNFANPDMVGHCGKLRPAIEAVETVDGCLARVYDACQTNGVTMLITADHGNCEQMIDETTGEPHTSHTLNPVRLWLVAPDRPKTSLRDGILADVAPTILELMGVAKSAEMTGQSLLVEK